MRSPFRWNTNRQIVSAALSLRRLFDHGRRDETSQERRREPAIAARGVANGLGEFFTDPERQNRGGCGLHVRAYTLWRQSWQFSRCKEFRNVQVRSGELFPALFDPPPRDRGIQVFACDAAPAGRQAHEGQPAGA
jgi:hypothetical protein